MSLNTYDLYICKAVYKNSNQRKNKFCDSFINYLSEYSQFKDNIDDILNCEYLLCCVAIDPFLSVYTLLDSKPCFYTAAEWKIGKHYNSDNEEIDKILNKHGAAIIGYVSFQRYNNIVFNVKYIEEFTHSGTTFLLWKFYKKYDDGNHMIIFNNIRYFDTARYIDSYKQYANKFESELNKTTFNKCEIVENIKFTLIFNVEYNMSIEFNMRVDYELLETLINKIFIIRNIDNVELLEQEELNKYKQALINKYIEEYKIKPIINKLNKC